MKGFLNKYFLYYPLTLLKGERIAPYLAEARKFQWKSRSEIEAHQLQRLKAMLSYAIEHVPYYQRTLDPVAVDSLASIADLANLPMLEKQNLIADFDELRSEKKFFATSTKTTGGSTGQAVTLLKNSDALARERAVTARSYEWANVGLCEAQARLWGIPLEYESRLYYKAVDMVANRRRFSAFNLNPESMGKYLAVLEKYRPTYLYGYASAIEEFTRFVHENGRKLPVSLVSIITTSEVLTDELRANIVSYTGLNPFNEYGCGEVGSVAHECEHHNLHIMADNIIVELLDEHGRPANQGEIVVTDLYNHAMPLIRYRLRDFGEFSTQQCPCGRQLPVLQKIHGRAYDFVVAESGTRIHPELVMYIFEALKKERAGVLQFQVVQKDVKVFAVKLVVAEDFGTANEVQVRARLEGLLGADIDIEFGYVDKIDREASGKLRLIKSEVPR